MKRRDFALTLPAAAALSSLALLAHAQSRNAVTLSMTL